MQENWRPVVGYEELYEVSDQGRVRSLPRKIICKGGYPRSYAGQLMTPQLVKGYPGVMMKDQGRNRRADIHKLVMEAFIGPCPSGQEALHFDGDRSNCRLGNLRYGTHHENMADTKRHGRDNAGSRHGASILTETQVIEIRKMRGRVSQKALGQMFGVGADQISRVQTRQRWKHI